MNNQRQQTLSKALDTILDILVNQYHPQKIILFGSMAGENIAEWSDIDLAIIKETPLPFLQRSREVALLCQAEVGVDFLVYTPAEFEQMIAEQNPFIVDEIIKKGKVLYERQPTEAVA